MSGRHRAGRTARKSRRRSGLAQNQVGLGDALAWAVMTQERSWNAGQIGWREDTGNGLSGCGRTLAALRRQSPSGRAREHLEVGDRHRRRCSRHLVESGGVVSAYGHAPPSSRSSGPPPVTWRSADP